MLIAKNITCSAGSKILLDDVSVRFEPGKINLIIGANGAGKSTLIKTLCNERIPDNGTVWYDQQPVKDFSLNELACRRAVLSQQTDIAFPLSVSEVVMMGRYPHFSGKPTEKDWVACRKAMEKFDITDLEERDYLTLSGGEKQRVHFARVLAQIWYPPDSGYRYLLLDEPLTFLDIHYQYSFMHTLQELAKATQMVIAGVVHDLNLAARFSDHLVLLHKGRVLASGDSATVLTETNIECAYQLKPEIQIKNGKPLLFFY